MTLSLDLIFDSPSFYLLCGLIIASLFFLMAGIRELKEQQFEGLLYLVVSLFFAVVHTAYLFCLPIDDILSVLTASLTFFDWAALIFGPALIALFLVFGIFNLLQTNLRTALIKIFFGLTLLCFLYMLGPNWPTDVKGILAMIWCLIWFEVELVTAR